MARQSSHRPKAEPTELDEIAKPNETQSGSVAASDQPGEPDESSTLTTVLDDEVDSDADATTSAAPDRSLWEDVRIDPVEIALPGGVGYTLRAYRMSDEVTPTDVSGREEEDLFAQRARQAESEDEADLLLDEGFTDEDLDAGQEPPRRGGRGRAGDLVDDEEPVEDATMSAEDEEEPADEEEATDEIEEAEPEEVPVFLSHQGKLLLFNSPEALVGFVRSGAPNDLAQLDTWSELVDRIEPTDIVPLEEDSYELDLVVENLRGGHDAWDPTLLIKAGEVARDLGYALRLHSVLEALAPGSRLDDLDEALRATTNGGISGFLGRRRLRRIGAQPASLGWRTIIGKISAAVDWRD